MHVKGHFPSEWQFDITPDTPHPCYLQHPPNPKNSSSRFDINTAMGEQAMTGLGAKLPSGQEDGGQ